MLLRLTLRSFAVILAAPVAVASLVACSADATSSAESAIIASPASQIGQMGQACGEDVAIHTSCAEGLTCVFPTSGPISEHTPGVCRRVSQAGGPCGDDVAIQTSCVEGLTCVFPAGGPISEHTPGVCEKRALEGEDCKSFGNPTLPECAPGLACQPGPIPDTAHCVQP